MWFKPGGRGNEEREGRLNEVTPEFTSPLQPLLFCPGCLCTSLSYTFHHWSTEKQQSSTLFLSILRRYENGGILPGSVFPACQAFPGNLWFLPVQQPSLVVRSMGWKYNQRQRATSLCLTFLICKVGQWLPLLKRIVRKALSNKCDQVVSSRCVIAIVSHGIRCYLL